MTLRVRLNKKILKDLFHTDEGATGTQDRIKVKVKHGTKPATK